MKKQIKNFLKSEEGMGVIEIVLIIVVLVGLAILFKSQINSIATGLFTSLRKQVNGF
jgi:Flp pilus assembly pilin Flp